MGIIVEAPETTRSGGRLALEDCIGARNYGKALSLNFLTNGKGAGIVKISNCKWA
jgi:hypothetical protein